MKHKSGKERPERPKRERKEKIAKGKTEKPKRKTNRYIKALRHLILLGLAGSVILLGINFTVIAAGNKYIVTPEKAAEKQAVCILVLGAGVAGVNNAPSLMLADRLLQGVKLYELGASDRLLMSGDHGRENYDEVNTMKRFAIDQGVPSNNIFMDHAGFSTYESMYRARDIFKAKKIIIVTQKYHLFRALYIARHMGLEAWGVPSDPRAYGGQEYRAAREVLARDKDFFFVMFKPKPTYLGDAIPVNGDGDLTNDKK